MDYALTTLRPEHHEGILAVFNHYVADSMAAYPETPMSPEGLAALLSSARGYPAAVAEGEGGRVVGFGLLRPWHPMLTFRRVAEVTCFIAPGHVGRGLGGRMLERLFDEAVPMGITTVLANISSENQPSISFHLKHGFTHCGLFRKVGIKFGREFDVIWMQKNLRQSCDPPHGMRQPKT